jgi:hypothetical protein
VGGGGGGGCLILQIFSVSDSALRDSPLSLTPRCGRLRDTGLLCQPSLTKKSEAVAVSRASTHVCFESDGNFNKLFNLMCTYYKRLWCSQLNRTGDDNVQNEDFY